MIKWRKERRDSGFLAGMDFFSSNPSFSNLDDTEVRDDNMDISEVRGEVNGLEKEESEEEVSDSTILREISQREILHWNYKGLTRFPTELLNHGAHIQELYLKENLVEQVPEKLYLKMPFLSNLHLSRNNISKIPKDFSRLSQLTLLDLSRNQLLEYPDCLNGIKTLKTLDLSHNRIQELPEKISELINLEYLVVISNSIKRVPESISLLKNLTGLYLSRNCIRELPDSLGECYSLRELYLDHNLLQFIPGSLVKLQELVLLSLSGNLLRYLPHLPFVSSPRILLEDNKYLTYLPYTTGCQQTLITYSNQASWSALSEALVENTLNGVWNLRVGGCGVSSAQPLDSLAVQTIIPGADSKILHLPPTLRRIFSPAEKSVPSLLELSLKAVYRSIWRGRIGFHVSPPSQIQTHISSCHLLEDDICSSDLYLDPTILPRTLQHVLELGPTSFCSSPFCNLPIFIETCLEIILKQVQRNSWGSGEPEITRVLSSRLYCSPSCRSRYFRKSVLEWEKVLLKSSLPWDILTVDSSPIRNNDES